MKEASFLVIEDPMEEGNFIAKGNIADSGIFLIYGNSIEKLKSSIDYKIKNYYSHLCHPDPLKVTIRVEDTEEEVIYEVYIPPFVFPDDYWEQVEKQNEEQKRMDDIENYASAMIARYGRK